MTEILEMTKSGIDLRTLTTLGRVLDEKLHGGNESRFATVRELLTLSLLKIRDKRGALVPLEMNAAQRRFEQERGRRNIVLKARQLGITTWVAARFLLNTITRPGTLSVQVAQDQESAEQIFRIVHRMVENLPPEVQGALKTSRANVRQVVFPRMDSEFRVETAADANAGRGLTIQNLHCSEVSRWPGDVSATLAALRAAVVPEGEIVLESTANGAYGTFYREWLEADESGYARHFFPWWMEKGYRVSGSARGASPGEEGTGLEGVIALSDEERDLCSRVGLDAEQIAFRRQMRREFGKRAREEFAEDAESCFLATGECVFDLEKLEKRLSEVGDPLEVRDNGRLEIYWPAQRGREYVVGVDAAGGGTEGDFSCVEVVERGSGLQCAEWYGHCSLQELAAKSARLGKEFNGALVAVERNNHGYGVLAYLEAAEKYANIYASDGGPGWITTGFTRPRMLEGVMSAVERSPELIGSRRTLRECKTFIRHEDGKCAAALGEHDDAVMALAVAWAVCAE